MTSMAIREKDWAMMGRGTSTETSNVPVHSIESLQYSAGRLFLVLLEEWLYQLLHCHLLPIPSSWYPPPEHKPISHIKPNSWLLLSFRNHLPPNFLKSGILCLQPLQLLCWNVQLTTVADKVCFCSVIGTILTQLPIPSSLFSFLTSSLPLPLSPTFN